MRARAWGSTLRKSDALKKCIAYQWYAKANDFYFMDVANKPNNKGKKKRNHVSACLLARPLGKKALAGEQNNFFTQEAFRILVMPTKSADKLQNSEVEA